MSKTARPTLIGIFVLAGLGVAFTTAILVSSFKLFSQEEFYVLYFNESVNGLNIGSAVKFKGVPVGEVSHIRIRWNQQPKSDAISVIIAIDARQLRERYGIDMNLQDRDTFYRQVMEGFRGRLQLESLITNQLFVELNYFPDAGRPRFDQLEPIYKEIPTLPSPFAKLGASTTDLIARLGTLDFKALGDSATVLLKNANDQVLQMNLPALSKSLREAAEGWKELASSDRLNNLLDNLNATLSDYRQLAGRLDGEVGSGMEAWRQTAENLRQTLLAIRQSSEEVRGALAPESLLRIELERALRDFAAASRSLRELAELLDRKPDSLLTGRDTNQP